MRIVLFSNGNNLFALYRLFVGQNSFQGLVIPDKLDNRLWPLIQDIEQSGYSVFVVGNNEQSWAALLQWLNKQDANLAIAIGFPYKIHTSVITGARYGIFNVHFSPLPKYKGPDPLFWQLKNGETKTAISIHLMNSEFDGGPVVFQKEVAVIPGETYGLLANRLLGLTLQLLPEWLNTHGKFEFKEQVMEERGYHRRPAEKDLSINWEKQTAQEIENLVNACNPVYTGAYTLLNGLNVRIIEVSPAELKIDWEVLPGSVVFSDTAQGLFVFCAKGNCLRINVLQTNEGIMSGQKMAALGLNASHSFSTAK